MEMWIWFEKEILFCLFWFDHIFIPCRPHCQSISKFIIPNPTSFRFTCASWLAAWTNSLLRFITYELNFSPLFVISFLSLIASFISCSFGGFGLWRGGAGMSWKMSSSYMYVWERVFESGKHYWKRQQPYLCGTPILSLESRLVGFQ